MHYLWIVSKQSGTGNSLVTADRKFIPTWNTTMKKSYSDRLQYSWFSRFCLVLFAFCLTCILCLCIYCDDSEYGRSIQLYLVRLVGSRKSASHKRTLSRARARTRTRTIWRPSHPGTCRCRSPWPEHPSRWRSERRSGGLHACSGRTGPGPGHHSR